MNWYEAEVRTLETRVAASGMKAVVDFYGSSTIRLWETLTEDMGRNDVLNLGFGGSTLEACVYFFDRLVVPTTPRSLVVYAGDNDLGDGRSPEQVLKYFQDFASKVDTRLPGIPFGFISIKPSPARAAIIEKIRQTNIEIAAEIAKWPNAYFIDLFGSMLNADGAPRPELFQADGLHLNASGYGLWTEQLHPYRDRIFSSTIRTSSPEDQP